MKKITLMFFFLCSLAIVSCKDSAVSVDKADNNKSGVEALLANTSWVLNSYSSGKYIGDMKQEIVSFYSNFKFERRWLNSSEFYSGVWAVSSGGDSIIVNVIDTITKNKLVINYSISKINGDELNIHSEDVFEYLSVPFKTYYAISGEVENTKNFQLKDYNILVSWIGDAPGLKEYGFAFGKGEFKSKYTKFVAYLNEFPPDDALIRNNNFDFKYSVGYISVVKGIVPQGKINDTLDYRGIGALNNRAIIYLSRDRNTGESFNWLSKFNKGFGLARGLYNNTQGVFDEWTNLSPLEGNTLVIDTLKSVFQFPNWR